MNNNQNIGSQLNPTNLQNVNVTNLNTNQTKGKTIKQKIRNIFLFLIFVGLIGIGTSVYLLIDDNKKYNTYIPIAADLISVEKINKSGIHYYKGTYKYIISKKEYFYKSKKLYSSSADRIIQIKYNKEDPTKLYDETASKNYFILLFSSIAFSFISMIISVSLSSSKLKEIITVQVIEQVTCVGGRRIYLSNINIPENTPSTYEEKYYVYFSNNLDKFNIGNKLTFNIYQYNEVFTTEAYRNNLARTIYNYKDDDFTLIARQN